jgi:O-antigen/teichoic acid export membrane protein
MHKKLGFNSLWLLLARVGTQVFSLAFVALAAWHLGVAGFGQFSLLAAIVFLANAVTTFGTDTLIVRDIARQGSATTLITDAFWLQCVLALIWVIVQQILAGLLLTSPQTQIALLVYSLSLWPLTLYTVCSAALRGVERMDLYLLLTVLGSGLQVLAAIAAILLMGDALTLVLGLVIVQIMVAAMAWWLCRLAVKDFKLKSPPNFGSLITLMQSASPLSLLTGLAILSQRMGLFVVSAIVGNVGAGIFSASGRITEGLKVGHQSVLGALMPTLLKQNGPSTKLFRTALWTMPLIGVLLALAGSILAKPIIELIYGDQYEAAAIVLAVVVWSLVPYAFNAVLSLGFVAHGAEAALARNTLVSVLLGMILIFVLTVRYELLGTALGVVALEVIQAGLLAWGYRTVRLQSQPEPIVYGL